MHAIDYNAVTVEMRYVLLGQSGVYRCALDEKRPVSDLMRTIKARHTAIQCKWWQLELYLAIPPEVPVTPVNFVAAANASSQGVPQQRPRYLRADDSSLLTLQTLGAVRLVSNKSSFTRPELRLKCTQRLSSWFVGVNSAFRSYGGLGVQGVGMFGQERPVDMLHAAGVQYAGDAHYTRVAAVQPGDEVHLVVVDSARTWSCARRVGSFTRKRAYEEDQDDDEENGLRKMPAAHQGFRAERSCPWY